MVCHRLRNLNSELSRGVGGQIFLAYGDVAVAGNTASAFAIEGFVVGLHSGQAIYITVIHAKRSGDEDGVVNLEVGRAVLAGGFDIAGFDELAILLDFAGYGEKGLQLGADVRLGEVGLDLLDESLVAAEVSGSDGAVDAVTVVCAVAAGDEGGDEFALPAAESAGAAQQHLDEVIEGTRGFRAEGHGTANAGKVRG